MREVPPGEATRAIQTRGGKKRVPTVQNPINTPFAVLATRRPENMFKLVQTARCIVSSAHTSENEVAATEAPATHGALDGT